MVCIVVAPSCAPGSINRQRTLNNYPPCVVKEEKTEQKENTLSEHSMHSCSLRLLLLQ